MPLVILSVTDYDPLCPVEIPALPTSTAGDITRRVSRTATLDGGAAFDDGGYADADRTIDLRWPTGTPALEARVQRLLKLYTRITVAIEGALYLAAPERYSAADGESRLTLLVASRLDAG